MNISILGCGWLGLPLAQVLADKGHTIKGSTTTPDKIERLSECGIDPYLITLDPELSCSNCHSFWESDLLILNIPPGRGREDVEVYHATQIRSVISRISDASVSRVIFISSTSVYPEHPGIVEEDDAIPGRAGRASGNALLKAEDMLMRHDAFSTTVVRFGGLYGYDRHPANYMAGRTGLDMGNAPVNLIHREDCIGIICEIIERDVSGEIFNGVSDGHPPRDMYYTAAAEMLGLEPPRFTDMKERDYKIVSNRKLKKELGYKFKHPNPMNLTNIAR